MSVGVNPKSVTTGLVFSVDGGNDRSYSRNLFLSLGTVGLGSAGDNAVSFPVNGTGTFYRLGYGQTFGGYTITASDVVYKYNLDVTGCHYHGFDTTVPAGVYATFSCDYFISTDAVNVASSGNDGTFLVFEQILGGGQGISSSVGKGTWYRATFTSGPTSTAGNLRADRKSTRLNSSHTDISRMPSSA